MDKKRVTKLLGSMEKHAQKRGRNLEYCFIRAQRADEMGTEFCNQEANKFYLSDGRKIEFECVMELNIR